MSRSICRVIQLAPALTGLVLLSSTAAADVCEAVLKAGAFNIYNSEYKRELQSDVVKELCKTRWNTVDEFKNLSHGFKGGFDYFKVFDVKSDGRYNSGNVNVTKDYENLCQKDNSEIRDRLLSSSKFQDASLAVEAWRDCVKDRKGFYAAPLVKPDGTGFLLNVHFIPGQGITATSTDVLKLVSYPTDQGFSCSLDGREIRDLVPATQGYGNTFFISCSKSKDASVWAVINTNLRDHAIGPFVIPNSDYAALLEKNENLARQVETASRQLSETSQQLSEAIAFGEASHVDSIRQRLSAASQDPNLSARLQQRQITYFIHGPAGPGALLDDGPRVPQNQRTLDTTYTNTLSYPIGVTIRTVGNTLTAANGTPMPHACSLKVRIDEQVVTTVRRWDGNCTETFYVPPNSTYGVGGADSYLWQWDEWR